MKKLDEDVVHFDLTTGRHSDVASTLRRRVGAYTREDRVGRFKIGITNNPDGRFSNGYARDYDEMVVLYRSASLDSVSQVECDLIEHNGTITENRIAGGGGNYGEPPFYLYLVIRYK
jgi:hypothetical protein